jgi:hypothetical protein
MSRSHVGDNMQNDAIFCTGANVGFSARERMRDFPFVLGTARTWGVASGRTVVIVCLYGWTGPMRGLDVFCVDDGWVGGCVESDT